MSAPIPAWRDGRLTPVDKLEVHRLGLRHPAVSVFVNAGGRTLLQRRAAGKYHTPGLWANACCTHPAWGEPAEACARRRLVEELGIDGLALVPRGRIEYRAELDGGLTEHEVVDLFAAEADPGTLVLAPDPREVWETRWIDRDALRAEIAAAPARFTPWLRIYLRDAADRLIPAA
ncbi:isopentenyl-diphosphate Delta-isomerase [Albimonas pacifica]|uniref:Isopentenyl-diphosphate Delta-isomerase n=1 Tax=Albimonas pacifica TaxID=1114924 RepID=A0A1I3CPC7_9RHOB|nr:isopentenyl-diphosphate delta-isomerase [Albimonas pacifica]SFH76337.1 isopentenyl-diphosphate delta-isomerase [Albimonas pacifica]